ncbi:alkaline phosphatase [Seminavis robusta]|uniref:Alkaline phosphatase n=1 Tax=Seminavis robusta TaxID=568900 RepID=A0A9N8HA15_9STRA|nr:alkaline phosphatase [Seminavis robusta]|eukprot:Sro210_g087660.1 alkaline phosphatase (643) ;mRNA; f:48251-50397
MVQLSTYSCSTLATVLVAILLYPYSRHNQRRVASARALQARYERLLQEPPVAESSSSPFFQHGVASFDPSSNQVILWTRVTDATLPSQLSVVWTLATDEAFSFVVDSSIATTTADQDYTVRVNINGGLQPYTFYYYKFTYCPSTGSSGCVDSITGRTKTAPAVPPASADAAAADAADVPAQAIFPQIRFATVSCATLQWGWFHAYEQIARRDDVDAVLHLGDYIYEHAPGEYGDIRDHEPPKRTVTLSDYRIRYAQYRREESLQKLHQQYPFITLWDDHEFVNNAWTFGSPEHDPETEGDYVDRKLAAVQAYREWLPFRERAEGESLDGDESYDDLVDNDDNNDRKRRLNEEESVSYPITPDLPFGVSRKLQYGNLIDIIVIDNRILHRDEQRGAFDGGNAMFLPSYYDTDHDMVGEEQKIWIKRNLKRSKAKWKILAQTVLLSPVSLAGLFSHSSEGWDGYHADRAELMDHIADNHIDNVVILAGDIHATIISDVPKEKTGDLQTWGDWLVRWPRAFLSKKYTSIAVEFVVTSVTSITLITENAGFIPFAEEIVDWLFAGPGLGINRHGQFIETLNWGYQIIDFQPEKVQADIYFTGDPKQEVDDRPDAKRYQRSYFSLDGDNFVQLSYEPTEPLDGGSQY